MRSINSADYQKVPRPVAVMPKAFAKGASTGRHSHVRGQVLYATSGLMLAQTDSGAWAVPSGRALLIPPRLSHNISMHGSVQMLTAYVAPMAWRRIAQLDCRVVHVSRLLDASLEAICEEPLIYRVGGRGGHLAAIILDEVSRARTAELVLPLPASGRLREVCQTLLADPSLHADLDGWAETAAMSRRTFTREFRKSTGLSFGTWRRQLRHLHSLRLRAEGTSMKSVAARVGYRSPQALAAMINRTRKA
jgi:AraC-like DNA-binding protein